MCILSLFNVKTFTFSTLQDSINVERDEGKVEKGSKAKSVTAAHQITKFPNFLHKLAKTLWIKRRPSTKKLHQFGNALKECFKVRF